MDEDPDDGGEGSRFGRGGQGNGKGLKSAHEVYELLVGEIGYNRVEFLRELKLWEIRAIVRGYRRRAALTWEPARFQSFVWLSARGAKMIKKPQDVVTFPWEKEAEPISDEDAEEIKNWLRSARKKEGSDG